MKDLLALYANELEFHLDHIVKTRDGNLFLAGGAHGTFAFKMGVCAVDPMSFEAFRQNLSARANYCEERDIRYLHAIAPDKESVLTELLPHGLELRSLIDVYRENCDAPFLDLRPPTPLNGSYYRTDTHWALPLQAQAALRIACDFGADERELAEADERIAKCTTTETFEFSGDLGSRLEPKETEWTSRLHPNWQRGTWLKPIGGWNDGLMHIFRNPLAPQRRLLVFGDSFGRAICNHLALFFSEVLFCRSGFFHPEMVDMMKPSHVLTQQVERFLDAVQSDRSARRFLLIPGINGSESEIWKEFWLELNCVLTPPDDAPTPESTTELLKESVEDERPQLNRFQILAARLLGIHV